MSTREHPFSLLLNMIIEGQVSSQKAAALPLPQAIVSSVLSN